MRTTTGRFRVFPFPEQIYLAPVLLAAALMLIRPSLWAAEETATNTPVQRIEIPGIHNAFRVSEKILSGSQPEGGAEFAALARLGVKTIVSVDGGKPDVEAARKFGLRYVHLPYGYDGIPTNRVAELAKLTAELNGLFFVHCHHGLHRGPAAVAVMCEASAGWTPTRAEAWLREAGTAADYPGLYRAVREFKPPTAVELAAVQELPEITKPSSLVEAMVAIDERFTWLKQSQKGGWESASGHPDISPAHEATLLWEQLRELGRQDDTKQRPKDYRLRLADAEVAADSLRKLLSASADRAATDAAFQQVTRSCATCHKKYRNN